MSMEWWMIVLLGAWITIQEYKINRYNKTLTKENKELKDRIETLEKLHGLDGKK